MTTQNTSAKARKAAWMSLAIFYALAGSFHLATPSAFVHVTPNWVIYPTQTVFLTGLCELAGAIALLSHRTRKVAAALFGLYAICVYPANIEHAVQDLSGQHQGLGWFYHAPRLFAQPFIVWWALYAGGLVGGLRGPWDHEAA